MTGTGGPPLNLAACGRAPNAFNTIRLLAALAVIVSHAFPLTRADEPLKLLTSGQTTMGDLAVYAFFLISGYLIPASFDRSSALSFATKRARRILPGLVVAVLVCALALGPVMSTLSTAEYFSSMGTWRFVGNALFLPVGYDLPGVFEGQPLRAVNGSLWSLKFELACYIGVPLLFMLARARRLAVVLALLACFVLARVFGEDAVGAGYYLHQMAALFRFFGMGMVCYLWADRITLRRDWALAALALTVAAAFTPLFEEVAAIAGSYTLIAFAYCGPKWFRDITAKGDISYGVYVYAFPVQQLLVPVALASAWGPAWLINTALAAPLIVLAGLASWLLVERPALTGLRK